MKLYSIFADFVVNFQILVNKIQLTLVEKLSLKFFKKVCDDDDINPPTQKKTYNNTTIHTLLLYESICEINRLKFVILQTRSCFASL